MEMKNVVVLDIQEYNRLMKLQTDLLKANEANRITFSYDYRNQQYIFYSTEDALKQAEVANKSLASKLEAFKTEYDAMRGYYIDNKKEIDERIQRGVERELKKMSIWKFWKWKKEKS